MRLSSIFTTWQKPQALCGSMMRLKLAVTMVSHLMSFTGWIDFLVKWEKVTMQSVVSPHMWSAVLVWIITLYNRFLRNEAEKSASFYYK